MAKLTPDLEDFAARVTFDLTPKIAAVKNTLPDRIHRIRTALHRLRETPGANPASIRDAEHALAEANEDIQGAFGYECVAEALEHVNEDLEMAVSVTDAGVYLHREHLLLDTQIFPPGILDDPEGTRTMALHVIAEAAAEKAIQERCRGMSEREREELFRLLESRLEARLSDEAYSNEPLPDRSDDELFS